MQQRTLKENEYEFTYKFFDYDYNKHDDTTKLEGKYYITCTEYLRYKYVNKLNKHFKTLFKTQDDIYDILTANITFDQNDKDPLLSSITSSAIAHSNIPLATEKQTQFLNSKVDKYIKAIRTHYDNINLAADMQEYDVIKIKKDEFCCLYLRGHSEQTGVIIFNSSYKKIKKRFKGHKHLRLTLIWAALFRYEYCKMRYQCSNPETILLESRKLLGIEVEMFSSIINVTLKYFCSLFYDLEKYFGCVGNFFNLEPIKGFYTMCPPYVEWIIELACERVYKILNNTKDVSILITLPLWCVEDRIIANEHCKKKLKISKPKEYDDTINLFKRSKYLVAYRIYCGNDYEFYCYNKINSKLNVLQNSIMVVSNVYKYVNLDYLPSNFITLSSLPSTEIKEKLWS